MRVAGLISAVVAVGVVLTGCSSAGAPGQTRTEAAATPAATQSAEYGGAAPSRAVRKVLVVVVENHSLAQMRQQMPWTAGLARRFGYASNYRGVTYPSLPNYLAIASGSTHGVSDDNSPPVHRLPGPTVFGQALANGRTATLYADGMPSNCSPRVGGDRYVVKHNPWAYFPAEQSLCGKHDEPATEFAADASDGKLPHVGLLIPNMCNDAHDCPLSVADAWIRKQMGAVFAGPDWKSGHLAVVITADTDDHNDSNRVLTVVAHPSQHHRGVTTRLDHYSLSRLLSAAAGASPLARARSAASMGTAFHLPS